MNKSTRNAGKPWSAGDKSELRNLARHNTPTRVIAFKLGRTPEAIYSKANEIDVSLRPTNQSPYGPRKK